MDGQTAAFSLDEAAIYGALDALTGELAEGPVARVKKGERDVFS